MVRLLLSYGADANIQDNQGTTALMFASERGHTHVARLLLERSQCDFSLTDKVRQSLSPYLLTKKNSDLWVSRVKSSNEWRYVLRINPEGSRGTGN